ncbi:MAG: MOSC domain-containing protein [Acidobacteriota bacterium]|nr:MOSC domain-containing protein [Acidobacteriota bacterium]MDE3043251.1 MOSC domain-containing protein [Acidobacteriota bacterium]MDE3106573.1 MOSC domain-containing protein [Acidobacteriota bacterium]MDE3222190.1 MOSC domain-containing protein [Acidobacteriota bacterium]
MFVDELWRYPVKSMGGERADDVTVTERGVHLDRAWGLRDVVSNTILSAKREGRLLRARASIVNDQLSVTLPDGRLYDPGPALDESLGRWLERDVRLVEAEAYGLPVFQGVEDFERDDAPLTSWEGTLGAFVDESPLHLVTTGDLAQLARERPDLNWDVRRFRPNVVIDAPLVSRLAWEKGQRLAIGEVEVEVTKGCTRCVMTTRAQPGGMARELDVLRHVARDHDARVGVRARVTRPGVARVGDAVTSVS